MTTRIHVDLDDVTTSPLLAHKLRQTVRSLNQARKERLNGSFEQILEVLDSLLVIQFELELVVHL